MLFKKDIWHDHFGKMEGDIPQKDNLKVHVDRVYTTKVQTTSKMLLKYLLHNVILIKNSKLQQIANSQSVG